MAQRSSRIPKTRLESLTDLVFGLALSIGSLSLLAKVPSTVSDAMVDIGGFAFSFLILISIWFRYTNAMSLLPMETVGTLALNTLLLFLISVEPYLLSLVTTNSFQVVTASILNFASQAYAIDIAGLMLILGLFAHQITVEQRSPRSESLSVYRRIRNTQYIASVWFAVSALPFFWTWEVLGTPFRFDMWYIALVFIWMSRISSVIKNEHS